MPHPEREKILPIKRGVGPLRRIGLVAQPNRAMQTGSALGIPQGMIQQMVLIDRPETMPCRGDWRWHDLLLAGCNVDLIEACPVALYHTREALRYQLPQRPAVTRRVELKKKTMRSPECSTGKSGHANDSLGPSFGGWVAWGAKARHGTTELHYYIIAPHGCALRTVAAGWLASPRVPACEAMMEFPIEPHALDGSCHLPTDLISGMFPPEPESAPPRKRRPIRILLSAS